MSLFDNKIQKEFELDFLVGKIKNAQATYDKVRNAYLYNDTDIKCDYYGDVDIEVESAWKNLQNLKNEFKEKFHFSYESYEHDANIPDNSLMSADQARALYNETVEKDNTELNTIIDKIKKAIIEHKQDCCQINTMKDYTKQKLERLGYKITFNIGSNDYLIQF